MTALLATTITQSEEVLTKAVANVAKVMEDGYEGAEILGIHFEGPYLDMVYKGAQPEQDSGIRMLQKAISAISPWRRKRTTILP